jgi:hypothetical protein
MRTYDRNKETRSILDVAKIIIYVAGEPTGTRPHSLDKLEAVNYGRFR